MIDLFLPSILETIYMVFFSTVFSLLFGFPLGIILTVTEENAILENLLFNKFLGSIINLLRSLPFIILMILVFPLSEWILGSSIGTTATIIPLSISATPFVARVIESSLKEVDKGIIDASMSMGATNLQIIFYIIIPEALPSIVSSITLTIINLIGYSAMAGAIGGGGLGNLAIRYGLYRFETDIMIVSLILIIILVQSVQLLGSFLSRKLNNAI